jgi:hypothetical protein
MICDRCGQETRAFTVSYFNTERICVERCVPAERAHPQFEHAREVETQHVMNGEFNFPGVGLPADLVVTKGEQ